MVIGIHKTTEPFEFDESGWFGYEKPAVLEAFRVLAKEGYYISISGHDYNEREKRLKKEYDKNHIKGDFSGNKSIEHCGEPIPGPGEEQPEEKKGIIYPTTFPKADFYYKHVLNEGNTALKEAASQFNDALLDEQTKKIAEQNKEITRLLSLAEKKENSISRLYYEKSVLEKENEELKKGEIPARYFDKALVDEQEEKIKKLEHEKLDILEIAGSCKRISAEQAKEIKRLGKEIAKLNGIIHDKNAVLSDVAEELRLSKIREKNLTEVCQKYMKENEELKKNLADKVVVKIDAQALKSAESALAYKEKVIAEKDEVIADLTHELKAKHKKYVWYKGAYEAAQQILNTIADYAAKHPDKKFSDHMVQDSHVECGTKVLVDKSVFEQIMKKAYGK